MNDDLHKRPALVRLDAEWKARARAENAEFLFGLAERLDECAEVAEAAGDQELAVEIKAASEAVYSADYLPMALFTMEQAHEEWGKLQLLTGKTDKGW